MNFVLLPTLEHMALVKIATTMWNQHDIRDMQLENFRKSELDIKWFKVESKVTENTSRFVIPKTLEKKLMGYIKSVGRAMHHWTITITCLLSSILFQKDATIYAVLPNGFCWTPQGTINRKKMAEVLVKDERLDMTIRYQLACKFCLEADVLMLRNKIPEFLRAVIERSLHSDSAYSGEDSVSTWDFWNINVAGHNETRRSRSFHCLSAFESSALAGNKAATEYFWKKLSRGEREISLVEVPNKMFDTRKYYSLLSTEVFCFLLSKMTEEQQKEVFLKNPSALHFFLNWPWQSFFLEAAHRHVLKMSGDVFFSIVEAILQKRAGYTDCNYQMLFGEFWKLSSKYNCYSYILNSKRRFRSILEALLRVEDTENIELILKYATPAQKRKYCPTTGFISEFLKIANGWDIIKLFMLEFLSSEDLVIKFQTVLESLDVKDSLEEKGFRNELLQLLDDITYTVVSETE